jgi:hypothetical protein
MHVERKLHYPRHSYTLLIFRNQSIYFDILQNSNSLLLCSSGFQKEFEDQKACLYHPRMESPAFLKNLNLFSQR